jgi:hypothetical protein
MLSSIGVIIKLSAFCFALKIKAGCRIALVVCLVIKYNITAMTKYVLMQTFRKC